MKILLQLCFTVKIMKTLANLNSSELSPAKNSELLDLIDCLAAYHSLTEQDLVYLLENRNPYMAEYLFAKARDIREKYYGRTVFTRGLIEFTNYCRNDCYYCGLRAGNTEADRYRLTFEEILNCCRQGHELGFRTFVLQGGEDPHFSAGSVARLVEEIRSRYPDCAVTLSLGEQPRSVYEQWFKAGAERYLLRHETRNPDHYASLHPPKMSLVYRLSCLEALKDIGYQVGCGFMVGTPGQTVNHLAEDLIYIKQLGPQMVGIGPFIPHHQTPLAQEKSGSLELTLFLLGLVRLLIPQILLPSTTALGTIAPDGRELGILAGANVVMPNLSPAGVRKKYLLYDNKICTGEEAAECRFCLNMRLEKIGYQMVTNRGDCIGFNSPANAAPAGQEASLSC
jgi:biotin synthase